MAEPMHRRTLNVEIDGVTVSYLWVLGREEYVVCLGDVVKLKSVNPEYVWRLVELMRQAYSLGYTERGLRP